MVGRSIGWLPALVVPGVPAAVVLAARSGGWAYLPAALALSLAVAGVPLGVGAIVSVYAPFRVPDTGSPFANRNANTGQGCVIGLVAAIATLANTVLLAPVVIVVALAHDEGAVVFGAVLAAGGAGRGRSGRGPSRSRPDTCGVVSPNCSRPSLPPADPLPEGAARPAGRPRPTLDLWLRLPMCPIVLL